jgi:Flp pilus assembly protein TadG
MLGRVKALWSDRRGNVAVIFALALIPITLLCGGAVDFNQAMNARTRLAQALDAAALAVGAELGASPDQATQMATDYINANYPAREIGVVQNIVVTLDDDADRVLVSGEARVATAFLGLMGIDHLNVGWTSEVARARQNLELVMVLDNTGSMGGSKIASLRDSAELLTEILFETADEPDSVRIGLVPFAATVNVGTQYERVWWMDPDARSPVHADWADNTPLEGAVNHWDLFDELRWDDWWGCVESRAIPHDIEDTPANNGAPETLFVPYFAPDEPDNDNDYANDYLNDETSGNSRTRITNLDKYDGANPSGSRVNYACTTTPILPLTNDEGDVLDAIDDMGASGTTNIPQGIGWGVRVISPDAPFTEGVSYEDRDFIKAMVILTDGQNVLTGRRTDFRSDYSAYGFSRNGRLGTTSRSSSTLANRLNGRTTAACDYAKEQGIRVYTITFQVSSSSTRQLMEDCATNSTLYFDSPSEAALRDAFEMIAGDLSSLRLSR